MKLYKQYLEERDGATVYYTDCGFVTYSVNNGGECYFSEIYVVPEKRNTMVPWQFYIHVVRAATLAKCTHITGTVDVTTKGWQLSEKLMLKLGFVLLNKSANMNYYAKKLTNIDE